MPKEATLADIEKSYDEAIKKAASNPEAVNELRAERAAAVADFRLKQVQMREKALWLREALSEWPLAQEFPELVTGDTEDDVRGSAKALHERINKRFEAHQRKLEIDRIVEQHMNGQAVEGLEGDAAAEPAV